MNKHKNFITYLVSSIYLKKKMGVLRQIISGFAAVVNSRIKWQIGDIAD